MKLKLLKLARFFHIINEKKFQKKSEKYTEEYNLIAKSKLFNRKWYLDNNPDVKASGMDPIIHYLQYGRKEGRLPSKDFKRVLSLLGDNTISPNIVDVKNNNFPILATNIKKEFALNKFTKKRLAVFASFNAQGKIEKDVIYYLKELKKVTDNIIFVTDNPVLQEELVKIEDLVCFALCERHGEYDFGSYKRGILYAQEKGLLDKCEELIVCNDSCYGPVYPLSEMFKEMKHKKCDFWGTVATNDVIFHIFSFFYVFKKNVFQSSVFQKFIKDIEHQDSWWDVVNKYEHRFTNILIKAGFIPDTYIPLCIEEDKQLFLTVGNLNKTLLPLTLMEKYRFPFIKKKGFDLNWEYAYQVQNKINDVISFVKTKNTELYDIIIEQLKDKCLSFSDLVKDHDIISFDVFDTLLIRPYVKPTDLFVHIENKYKAKGFALERIAAEQRARNKYNNKEDITYDNIYEEILPEFFKFKDIEINFEKQILRKHPKNYKLYKEAIKQHKKIIVTSDMYLSSKLLEEVLRKNGYTQISKVFVSSEYNKCKGTGSLYKELKRVYRNKKILHIGDNMQADIVAAKNENFSTYYVEKYIDVYLKNAINFKFKMLYDQYPSVENSIVIALSAYRFVFKHDYAEYYKDLGYSFGGPLALGYCQFIADKVARNNIDTLLFVSRDGYVLKKVFEKMYRGLCETFYIYAPRVLNIKCFADWRNESPYLASLLDIFHIKKTKNPDLELEVNKKVYNTKLPQIKKQAKLYYNKYMEYIKSMNIKGKNLASVDMTTGAFSSQIFLSKFFNDRYKFGIFSASFKNNPLMKYYTYNHVNYNPWDTKVAVLTELLITAPEPPVADIDKNKPVYNKLTKDDELRIKASEMINIGIMDFVNDYQNWFGEYQIQLPFGVSFSCLDFLIKYPSACDEQELKKIKHSNSISNNDFVSVYDYIRR